MGYSIAYGRNNPATIFLPLSISNCKCSDKAIMFDMREIVDDKGYRLTCDISSWTRRPDDAMLQEGISRNVTLDNAQKYLRALQWLNMSKY